MKTPAEIVEARQRRRGGVRMSDLKIQHVRFCRQCRELLPTKCAKCARIVGDYQTLYGVSSAITRKMDGLAWRNMLDERMRRPGTPFNFVEKDGRYIPEGYSGELKAQPNFDSEAPF